MTNSITAAAYRALAQVVGHDPSWRFDAWPIGVSRPLIDGFFKTIRPNQFEAPSFGWRNFWAQVPPPPPDPNMSEREIEMRGFFPGDRQLVGASINCDAGLLVFFVETDRDGLWGIHVMRSQIVAETEGTWDRFKRFIGYAAHIKTDMYGMNYLSDAVVRHGVKLVVGLSELPAAQKLYEQVCQ